EAQNEARDDAERRNGAGTPPAGSPAFPEQLRPLSAANRGGWVYDVEDSQSREQALAADRIRGAWRIDEHGDPTGEYVANRSYQPAPPAAAPRRRRELILVPVAVLIVAAAALALSLTGSSKQHPQQVEPARAVQGAGPPTLTGTPVPSVVRAPVPSVERAPSAAHASHTTSTASHTTTTARRSASPPHHRGRATAPTAPRALRLTLAATGPLWVCLQDARGRPLVNGQILAPGQRTTTFASTAYRMYLGNGAVKLLVDNKQELIAPSANPVAYAIGPHTLRLISGVQPPCA
ncbi:MAG: hypothetical protein JO153_18170, partial [Solirubrobacterales bacterium]|nr:hypothetical protein [Solirubrobacterales bacterium]